MAEILLAIIALGLFVVAYAIFALRTTLYWLKEEIRTTQPKGQAIAEATARNIAEIANILDEWRETAVNETKNQMQKQKSPQVPACEPLTLVFACAARTVVGRRV